MYHLSSRLFCLILFSFSHLLLMSSNNDLIFKFNPRDGLYNITKKLSSSDTVRVAYLGGSITAQNGWRTTSFDYLKNKYPETTFVQIDGSMGGTGSLLGVLRLELDVLKYNPDLVFVEFAVNDSKVPLEKVICSMEGIVRKIWSNNSHCDICFVYTTTDKIIEEFGLNRLPNTIRQMEKVAEYYKIPSVYMPFDIIEMLKDETIEMKKPQSVVSQVSGTGLNKYLNYNKKKNKKVYFSQDGVHPYLDTGHVFYMDVLADALNYILSIDGEKDPRKLTKPYSESNFENTQKLAVSDLYPNVKWHKVPKDSIIYNKYKSRFDEIWIGEIGASLEFYFKGKALVCYDVISQEGCRLEINIDGEISYINRFDAFCTYDRFHFSELVSGLDPNVTHHVQITVTNKGLNKEEILKKNNNEHFLKKYPEKYNQILWLLNSIFVIK